MAKRKGLPLPVDGPMSLPPVQEVDNTEESHLDSNVRDARLCPKCNKPGRVVSNYLGVNVHCGPCKIHWPITNTAMRPEDPAVLPRGFQKRTAVEPDWNIAFDRDVDEK